MNERPIYLPRFYRFFPEAEAATDFLIGEGGDPAEELAHPCKVTIAGTHDILDCIIEGWMDQFEDPDAEDLDLSDEAREAIARAQELVEREAPTVWIPVTNERVVLSADLGERKS